MKAKKCPYCGKRISYSLGFASRRKGEYFCTRCGKESRVTVEKKIFIFFSIAVLISVGIMFFWIRENLISNPLGIVLVAVPPVLFMLITPKFLNYLPLKKYKKSMEAKKAGRFYSDNFAEDTADDFVPNISGKFAEAQNFAEVSPPSKPDLERPEFEINTSVFNKIKDEKNAERLRLRHEAVGDIDSGDEYDFDRTDSELVSVINDVSESHASSSDKPLKKIHSDSGERYYERHRYYEPISSETKKKKNNTNRYSANRKF